MTDTTFPPEPSPWTVFTTAEVAQVLKVSETTVRALKDNGELEALDGVRNYRFPGHTVIAYLNRNRERK